MVVIEKNKAPFILFLYHFVFIVLSYEYAIAHNGDSHFYWGQTFTIRQYFWFDFLHYGNDSVLFLNYPFIQLGVPFFVGFLMYGTIGFLGILKAIRWAELVTQGSLQYKGINLVYLVFLLPNLHFWTATLGKEPLVFFSIASVFYALASKKYTSISFIVACVLLMTIRPHVALMLLMAIMVVLVFHNKFTIAKRIQFGLFAIAVMGPLFYGTLQLAEINYFNWNRIQYFNHYSILSFRHSGSYVPMLEYNYLHRLFAFMFQPLFFDAHKILLWLASLENALVLTIHSTALFFILKCYNRIAFYHWMKIVLAFAVISSLLYVQRYANLGIFMRTKIQFLPFELIALFCIIKQGLTQSNPKTK